ncbi:MAG: aminopeptidase, partial [Ruminiclostridium sp.]|nr:aminopeptidase [Ruminiclostridium sp.]
MEKTSKAKELKEKLFLKRKNTYEEMTEEEIEKAEEFCEGYKEFLDAAKTEREACNEAVRIAESNGFKAFNKGVKYNPGDRVYLNNRGKSVILAVIGKQPIENGVNIVAAHIDSPRLDLKQNPLYENEDLGYFKTHYYGGIKKYQWPALPLSLHGV